MSAERAENPGFSCGVLGRRVGGGGGQVAGGPTDMEITTVVVASVNANGAMR